MLEKLKKNINAAPKALIWILSTYLVVSLALTLMAWRVSKLGGFLLTLLLFWHLLDRGSVARLITVTCSVLGALFCLSVAKELPLVMLPMAIGCLYFAWYLQFSKQVKTWLGSQAENEQVTKLEE
jgi:hypothetical protein